MESRRPNPGELYRHFKNKIYQIITIAKHSETGQELVIYQAMYGEFGTYARPLEMFVSEVEHQKYPQVKQKYRFEKITADALPPMESQPVTVALSPSESQPVTAAAPQMAKPTEEETADPRLLRFLDADTYHDKYKVLQALESNMTERLINDFSVILDVVIPEGDLSERFSQLKQCVATQARYETSRLR